MHYLEKRCIKPKFFCIKVKNMLNGESLLFLFCVKMYTLSIKIHKEREEGIAYLCHVGKWIP